MSFLALGLLGCPEPARPGDDADAGVNGDAPAERRDAGEIGGTCETGCTGFSYCDVFSGMCRPGCANDEACEPREFCELTARTCECAPGAHACGAACVDSASPASCGSLCSPCPAVPNGTATCTAGACGIACSPGYQACEGACVSCPTEGVVRTTCSAARCLPTECAEGYGPCSAGCCRWQSSLIVAEGFVYDLDVTVIGSTIHGVGASTAVLYFEGSRSAWTSESIVYANYPHVAIVGPGPTLLVSGDQDVTSYRHVGSTWTSAGLEAGYQLTDAAEIDCVERSSGAACLVRDRYATYPVEVSASGAVSREPTVQHHGGTTGVALALASDGSRRMALTTTDLLTYRTNFEYDLADDPMGMEISPGALGSTGQFQGVAMALIGSTPHILVNGGTVRHLTRAGGAWVYAPVGIGGFALEQIEVSVDASDHLHAVWVDGDDRLWYGYFDGVGWTTAPVTTRARAADIVVLGGRPHIVVSTQRDTVEAFWLP